MPGKACTVTLRNLPAIIWSLQRGIVDDFHRAVAVEVDVQIVHLAVDTVALQPSTLEPLHHAVQRVFHDFLVVAVLVRAEVVGTIDSLRSFCLPPICCPLTPM